MLALGSFLSVFPRRLTVVMDGATHRVQRRCMAADKNLQAVAAVTRISSGDGAEPRGDAGGSGYGGRVGYGYGGYGGWDGKVDDRPVKLPGQLYRCFRCGVVGHRATSCSKPPAL